MERVSIMTVTLSMAIVGPTMVKDSRTNLMREEKVYSEALRLMRCVSDVK